MLAACIGHALKSLSRAAAKGTPTHSVHFVIAEIRNSPPRHPRAECVIAAIRRSVICRRRSYRPIRFRIDKPAAGVIFRFYGKQSLAADKMRSFGLDLGCHLKFGTAKLLYLKRVLVTAARKTAVGTEFDIRIAKIRVVRDREFKVEGPKGIQISCSFCDLIILLILYRIG